MTDGRKALQVRDVHAIPGIPGIPAAASPAGLHRGWAWFAGLAGPAVVAFATAVEPVPADPDAATPWWAGLVFTALLTVMALAAVEAAKRRPVALSWAAAGAAVALGLSITCPASGHHAGIGLWWFGQLAVSGGALGAALWGRRRS